jgi:predicted MFS family arabinose efflux permease
MILHNPYFRALVFSAGMSIALFCILFPENQSSGDPRRVPLLLSIIGIAGVVTTLLVGTLSGRSEKPWPWVVTGFASLGCWLSVTYAMLLLQKTFAAR